MSLILSYWSRHETAQFVAGPSVYASAFHSCAQRRVAEAALLSYGAPLTIPDALASSLDEHSLVGEGAPRRRSPESDQSGSAQAGIVWSPSSGQRLLRLHWLNFLPISSESICSFWSTGRWTAAGYASSSPPVWSSRIAFSSACLIRTQKRSNGVMTTALVQVAGTQPSLRQLSRWMRRQSLTCCGGTELRPTHALPPMRCWPSPCR